MTRIDRAAIVAIALAVAAGLAPVRPAAAETIRIGWTAWADAELVTQLIARLIEDHSDHQVERVLVDIALQYQGVARGDLDAMLMAWLPDTHADYQRRFADRLVDLGPIYTGARLGWVVPAYVPRDALSAIPDLAKPEVARALNRQIYGIDPGAGLTRLSEAALDVYRLDRYTLIASSGAAMTAMIERAHRRQDWIVATAWRPHWMFQAWDLRFLDDPERALGGRERVHAMVRRGLDRTAPWVVDLLARLYLPLDEVKAAMAEARAGSVEAAVTAYIDRHPARVRYWLSGDLD